MRFSQKMLSAIAIVGATIAVQVSAATLRLDQDIYEVSAADTTLSVDILLDFEGEPTIGGAVDLNFNNEVFSFNAVTFGESLVDLDPDTDLRRISVGPDIIQIAFVNEAGFSFPGEIVVATVVLNLDLEPSDDFTTGISPGGSSGGVSNGIPFLGLLNADTRNRIDVTVINSNVRVSPVPLPASIYLFAVALLPLIRSAKLRK